MSDKPTPDSNAKKFPTYFHYVGKTDTGKLRDHNEDDYMLPVFIDTTVLDSKGYLYVLADGMGGHQKGEVASEVTVKTVPNEYYNAISPLDGDDYEQTIVNTLEDAIGQANLDVMKATEGGGTTIVAAVLHEDFLVTMNVGDSRAYLLRDKELHLISRDHSLVSRLVEMGKITAEEALTHPRRNVLYQALGQGADLEIHIETKKLQVGDTIILCSDGLWGEIDEADLRQTLITIDSPQAAAQQLVDLANDAGGPDNITVIIVKITDEEPPAEQQILMSPEDTQPTINFDKANLDR